MGRRGMFGPTEAILKSSCARQVSPRKPAGQPAQPHDGFQRLGALIHIELANILGDNVRHGHTESCSKVLLCHRLLLVRRFEQHNQTVSQIGDIPGFIEIHSKTF